MTRKTRFGSARMFGAVVGSSTLALALALAGCSGNGANSGSSSGSITIGVIVNETGATAGGSTGSGKAAEAWAKWVNKTQGGVNGHTMRIVAKDDKGDAATATSLARDLVERDHVAAVLVQSAVAPTAISSYLAAKNIPMLANDDGQKQPNSPKTWFTVEMGQPFISESAALVAKDAGADSMVAAVCSEVAGCAAIGDQLRAYMPKIHSTYKGLVTIAEDSTSATAQCLQIVKSGAKAVANYIGVNPAKNMLQSCRAQGFKGDFVQLASYDGLYRELNSKQLGVMYSFPWWSNAAPVKEYRDVMAKYAPGVNYKGSGPDATWASLKLFDYAMKKSGPAAKSPVTGKDVIAAYQSAVKNVTLDGLLPQPITYAESGNSTINCFWPMQSAPGGVYKTLQGSWTSGNGAKGDLASECVE